MAKIVIDARESGTSTGRYVDKMLEYLHKLDHDHQIIVLAKPGRAEFLEKLLPKYQVVKSAYKEFSFSEQLGLWRQLLGLQADLIHFPMPQQPIMYRGRTVTSVLDLTTTRFTNPAKNWLIFKTKQAIYGQLIKYVARKSAGVITISQFVKRDVAQYCNITPGKISVVYPAADKITARAQPISRLTDANYLLYVGKAFPHKNLKRLVDAFSVVRRTQPSLLLVFAGSLDKNYELLQNYITQRAIGGIYFSGYVDDAQLRWLYENAKAYAFPSLSEGFGLPGLEAMVHGAPVASSDATCLPEIYGDAALYFDPLDVKDMATKINQLISSESLRAQLIKKGHSQVGKYSWQRTAEQTLDVYQKAIARQAQS